MKLALHLQTNYKGQLYDRKLRKGKILFDAEVTFDEDYTIFDYAHDYLIHYTQMPTEEDLEYMAAEAKIEEKLLERG